MLVERYISRVDVNALHATFINSKKRSANYSVRKLLGEFPILSDEIESRVRGKEILTAFKAIFPDNQGTFEKKKKKKKPAPGVAK